MAGQRHGGHHDCQMQTRGFGPRTLETGQPDERHSHTGEHLEGSAIRPASSPTHRASAALMLESFRRGRHRCFNARQTVRLSPSAIGQGSRFSWASLPRRIFGGFRRCSWTGGRSRAEIRGPEQISSRSSVPAGR